MFSVAFHPKAQILASIGDNSVRLWDIVTGRLLRKLEGHTSRITSVAFVADGRLVASKGGDEAIRIWSSESGACLCVIPEPTSGRWPPGLAFHPKLPLLAAVGSDANATDPQECDDRIRIWELDLDVLLGQAP